MAGEVEDVLGIGQELPAGQQRTELPDLVPPAVKNQ